MGVGHKITSLTVLTCILVGLVRAFAAAPGTPAPTSTRPAFGPTPAPPIEQNRLNQTQPAENVTVVSGLAGSKAFVVSKIDAAHFSVNLSKSPSPWFCLQVHGPVGTLVRIDFLGVTARYWATLNPVACDTTNVEDPKNYDSKDAVHGGGSTDGYTKAANGAAVPDDSNQKWKFIRDTWHDGKSTFSVVVKLDSADMCVAMRYPFTFKMLQDLQQKMLAAKDGVLLNAGKTTNGLSLDIIKLVSTDKAPLTKPTILFYGREHADEPDSSWACVGAYMFLTSADPKAIAIRKEFNFLFIPILDPDGSENGTHDGIGNFFSPIKTVPETQQYAAFFHNYVKDGNRLDYVFNLHNVQSSETPAISPYLFEPKEGRYEDYNAFNSMLKASADGESTPFRFPTRRAPNRTGYMPTRLGGYLNQMYGSYHFFYELNAQAPTKHLLLFRLQQIGKEFVTTFAEYYNTAGPLQLPNIDARLAQQKSFWTKYGSDHATDNMIFFESSCILDASLAGESVSIKQGAEQIP